MTGVFVENARISEERGPNSWGQGPEFVKEREDAVSYTVQVELCYT